MKASIKKITQSIIPVILLLAFIFFVLIFVEYRASQNADKAQYIYITNQTKVTNVIENEMNIIVEVDFSDNPRIILAQKLIEEKKYIEAENIYYSILSKEASSQIHNWLGVLYLKQQKYDKAIVSFSNALKINNNNYRARYNRALVYSTIDELQNAIDDYKLVIQMFNAHSKSHFNLALALYKQKNYEEAIEEFITTIELSNGEKKMKSFYLLGKSYLKSTPIELQKAIESFNEAIRLKPNHISSRIALIEAQYPNDKEDYKIKLKKLEALSLLEFDNINVYKAITNLYLSVKKDKKALINLEKALLHEPNNIGLRFEMVDILINLKKYQEASSLLEIILTIDDSNIKAYFLIGRINYIQKKYQDSLFYYDKILSIKEHVSPEVLNNIGLLYVKLKRYDEAIDVYKKALKLKSNYPEVYYNLGLLAMKQKSFLDAQKYFEKAIELRFNYHQAYYNLGLVFTKKKENEKAIDIYEKILNIKPDLIRVKLNLAVRYSKLKKYNKAQIIYEEILQKDDEYFIAWLNLGLVHYQKKEYELSVEALKKAIDLEQNSDKTNRALAKSYGALKMHDEAISILKKLLGKNPSDVKTRLAYARSYYRAKKINTALREYKKVLKLDQNNIIANKMVDKIETKKGKEVKKNSVKIVLVSILLSCIGTTALLAKEKIEKHDYDISIESGLGYDSNPFATPSSSYYDLTKTAGGALVNPDIKSGAFIPVKFNADYEYRYKQNIRLLANAKYSGKFFMDSTLENADEYKTDLSATLRFRLNKYKREINRVDLKAYVGNVHEIYVDHDDGTIKTTSSGDQSNRYQYIKKGIELKYKYDFKKIDFLVRGIFEPRDYETPATWSSLDHDFISLKVKTGYQFDKKLYVGSYFEYKLRNYKERKSYEIDIAGDISLVLPGVNYSYNDIRFFVNYKVNKSYKVNLNYLISSRTDNNQGYADYLYHKLSWINNYKFSKKISSSLKLDYYVYDYKNAYAYDNNTSLDKKESYGYRVYLDTKYKFTSKWIGNLNIHYRDEKSTDRRYEYEELITMLNIKYRF